MPTEATPVAKLHNTSIHAPDLPYGQISSSPADNSAGDDHLSQSSNTIAEVPVVLVDSDVYDSVVVQDPDLVRHHYLYTKDLCTGCMQASEPGSTDSTRGMHNRHTSVTQVLRASTGQPPGQTVCKVYS